MPKALAYATVVGLPVAVGLHTAFVPMPVHALLGSPRVLSVSSTATLAILTGTPLGRAVPDGDPARLAAATATLAVLVGAMLHATLAAVVIVYAVGLIAPAEFRAIRGVRTMEFLWTLVACAGVLIFGTLQGIVVAILAPMIGLASQAAQPRVSVIARKRGSDVLRLRSPASLDDELFDGPLIVRPEGRLVFVNAQPVAERIRALVAEHGARILLLDMSRATDIEYTALQALIEGDRRLEQDRSVELWLAGLNPGVSEVVEHAGLAARLGPRRLHVNTREAIARFEAARGAIQA
ncbi:MAG TPA: SulP family inorganic anion transporter [Burkholderiaceae bacterium]|nr:SulP family inorganic anion transporter [Burkholderiaceae bacterium]